MKTRLQSYILPIITVISGLLISSFYYFFLPKIKKTQELKENQVMHQFFKKGTAFLKLNSSLTLVRDKQEQDLGFVCKTESNSGYGGKVHFIVALDNQWKILDFLMTEHAETPGLGTLVNEPAFRKAFIGIYPTWDNLPKGKEDFKKKLGIDVISGATYSSMATVEGMGNIFKKTGDFYQTWQFEQVWEKVSDIYSHYAKEYPSPIYRRGVNKETQGESS